MAVPPTFGNGVAGEQKANAQEVTQFVSRHPKMMADGDRSELKRTESGLGYKAPSVATG